MNYQFTNLTFTPVEDVVDYRIYIYPTMNNLESYKDRLNQIRTLVNEKYVKDYIWQNESFELNIVEGSGFEPTKPQKQTSINYHFYGSTKFLDNIEDEWFIVYILFELSKFYSDMIIRYIL